MHKSSAQAFWWHFPTQCQDAGVLTEGRLYWGVQSAGDGGAGPAMLLPVLLWGLESSNKAFSPLFNWGNCPVRLSELGRGGEQRDMGSEGADVLLARGTHTPACVPGAALLQKTI